MTHGLPFRLTIPRGVLGGNRQEGTSGIWTLDITVGNIEVRIPRVRAARTVGGIGVTPLTLEEVQGTEAQRRVYLVASGVVRITGGARDTEVQIVDVPDPFDPDAPTGAVIRLTARPPHFLFGESSFRLDGSFRGPTPAQPASLRALRWRGAQW